MSDPGHSLQATGGVAYRQLTKRNVRDAANMGAVMIAKLEQQITGVVCLHCRMQTSFPDTMNLEHRVQAPATARPNVVLIRCTACGKEAPYLTNELMVLDRIPNFASCAA